jgi:hypothetical protein
MVTRVVTPRATSNAAAIALVLVNATPLLGALAYALIVVWHGYPALRHDWAWPTDRASLAALWTSSTSGWDPSGIGAPNLHLNDYLVGGSLCLIGWLAGTHAALFALALGVGLACSLGASALAGTFDAHPVTRAGVALFCLFNPWVYTETVAGHTYMLLAFGALTALLSEVRREELRPRHAALLVALSLVQLQFFLPVVAIALLMGLVRRSWLPLVTGIVVAAPVLVGLAAEYGAFRGVPLTLAWELSQSVPAAAAMHLSGYFAGYTQSIDPFDAWPMAVVLGIAIFGVGASWRTSAAAVVTVTALVTLGFATGLRGPLSGAMLWLFTHIPAAALFRELFDVLGFTAIAYAAAVSLACARSRAASMVLLACGIAFFASWIVWSPWAWWVPADTIPRPAIVVQADTRFALLPAFQPLMFGGRGSGLDPDAYARGSVTPLNVQAPQFPVDAALARYAINGDGRWLAALGVSSVTNRPWLSSDRAAQSFQTALARPAGGSASSALENLKPQPLVALLPLPNVVTFVDEIGAGNIFFGDAAEARGPEVPTSWSAYRSLIPVRASNRYVNASDGWVDVRLSFAADPRLAQAFGGAATTTANDLLPLSSGVPALVFVEGTLVDQRDHIVSAATGGYHWVNVAPDITAVRCRGLCAVAAQGYPPALAPLKVTHAPPAALTFQSRAPWWFETIAEPGGAATLRLNNAFDTNWIALADGNRLTHVRIDTAVNGWLLPARDSAQQIRMIQWPAAVQAVLEAVGAIWVLFLIGTMEVKRRERA